MTGDVSCVPQKDPTGEDATLHELVEALTAVGNYLEVANYLLGTEPAPGQKTLGEAVEKSLAQMERARAAARQLRELFKRVHHDGQRLPL